MVLVPPLRRELQSISPNFLSPPPPIPPLFPWFWLYFLIFYFLPTVPAALFQTFWHQIYLCLFSFILSSASLSLTSRLEAGFQTLITNPLTTSDLFFTLRLYACLINNFWSLVIFFWAVHKLCQPKMGGPDPPPPFVSHCQHFSDPPPLPFPRQFGQYIYCHPLTE